MADHKRHNLPFVLGFGAPSRAIPEGMPPPVGTPVVLMGLRSTSRCNGRHGVVVRGPDDAAVDRIAVRLAATLLASSSAVSVR